MSNVRLIVAQLPELLPSDWQAVDTLAIVVDTLRFTSTACQALAAGAQTIQIAAEVEAARRVAAQIGPSALLCGERQCKTIDGFDLGNSPLEYTPSTVSGRDLVFSTTNGTRAVLSVSQAREIALGSLLNRTPTAQYAYKLLVEERRVKRVVVVCAGTDGEIAAEDVLTAGAIVEKLVEGIGPGFSAGCDSNTIARTCWQQMFQRLVASPQPFGALQQFFEKTRGGENLLAAGFRCDLAAVAKVDTLQIVPVRTSAAGMQFKSSDQLARQ